MALRLRRDSPRPLHPLGVGWIVVAVTFTLAAGAHQLLAGLAGMLSWLVIPGGWIMMSRMFFGFFDRRQREMMLQQFPDALAMIVRSVRVGIPVQESIRTVAREAPHPTGPEFSRFVNEIAVGVSMEDALGQLARRSGLPEYRFFATAISLQTQTGGTLSETLENLADVIRKRAALKAKGHALTSEARRRPATPFSPLLPHWSSACCSGFSVPECISDAAVHRSGRAATCLARPCARC